MITLVPWFVCLLVAAAFSSAGGPRPAAAAPAVAERRVASAGSAGGRLLLKAAATGSIRPDCLRAVVQPDAGAAPRPETPVAPAGTGAAATRADVTRAVTRDSTPEPRPPVGPVAGARPPSTAGLRVRGGVQPDGSVDPDDAVMRPMVLQPAAAYPVRTEHWFFPARIDGRDFQLEAMLYRPDDASRHALVVFSHGRNGMFPARDPNTVNGYGELCHALAAEGHVVAYVVRRGYGNSEGPDSELQDTAVLSGLEGAKDYAAAVAYWRASDFVLPDRVVVMGQSQGGWVTLAGTTVAMEGVLGAVNISGGTNYRLMGTGAVTSTVQDHWVAGCSQLGAQALVSSFWIYSENDLSISGPTARRMFDAFTVAGGTAAMLMLPPFGTNGHGIVGQPDLFIGPLNDYLAAIGFGDRPYAAPSVGPITGAETAALGGTAVLTASVTGFPAPALHWRQDGVNLVNGGDVTGATSPTLRIDHLEAVDAGSYTLMATNLLGAAESAPAMIQFPLAAPAIQTQPQSRTVQSGAAATFTVGAIGNPPPTYQWQRRPAGADTWSNLAEGGGFAGVTGATLTVGGTVVAMSGDQFRCVSTNAAGVVASDVGILTVNTPATETPAPSPGGGGGADPPWLVVVLLLGAGLRRAGRQHRRH